MNAVDEVKLNDYICRWVDAIDCTFYKEAVHEALDYSVPNIWFKDFLDRYIKGKWYILIHQN